MRLDSIQWKQEPEVHLKGVQNEELLLLKSKGGTIHICKLIGNLPSDEHVKVLDLSRLKIFKPSRTGKWSYHLL